MKTPLEPLSIQLAKTARSACAAATSVTNGAPLVSRILSLVGRNGSLNDTASQELAVFAFHAPNPESSHVSTHCSPGLHTGFTSGAPDALLPP